MLFKNWDVASKQVLTHDLDYDARACKVGQLCGRPAKSLISAEHITFTALKAKGPGAHHFKGSLKV